MKSDTVKVVDVRAVDIGYFSTKVSLGRKVEGASQRIETLSFPSVAPKLSQGLSPESATRDSRSGCVVNIAGVNHFVGRDVEFHCSGKEPREVLPNFSETPRYKALFLGALHYLFEDSGAQNELVIKELVLGLPLNTYDSASKGLINMAEGEHLLPSGKGPNESRRVTIEHVSVIFQPQGALLSHGINNPGTFKKGWVLVVDAGGGTLDWFVTNGKKANWQMSGAHSKSMLACAYEVANSIKKGYSDNFDIVSRIDKALRTDAEHFTIAGKNYLVADHVGTVESVLAESIEKMDLGVGIMDSMNLILFTGGGAKLFHRYFLKKYKDLEDIVRLDEDLVFSNVRGFQVFGEIYQSRKSAKV